MRFHDKITVLVAIAILFIAGCTDSQETSDEIPATSTVVASPTVEKVVAAVEPVLVPTATSEPVQIYPTRIPPTKTPPPTKIPPPTATWDPASENDAQQGTPTVVATAVLTATPANTATPRRTATPESTATPVAEPPPYHFLTEPEVEAALSEVGCSGWKQVQIGDITYNRVCSDDANYAANVLGEPPTSASGSESGGENCNSVTDGSVRFTTAPTDLSFIRSIVPPGSPSGGTIAAHSYIHGNDAIPGESMRVPVYATADSTLTAIAFYLSNDGRYSFYFLEFGVTCEFSYLFDHIVEVVPKIAEVAPTTASTSSATNGVSSMVKFEAGELIGYVGEGTWDFGASDTTRINQFANQQRYVELSNGQSLHQVCPYDYYDEPLKSQLYSIFADPGGTFAAVDNCEPAKDVLGSAAGQWFDTDDIAVGRPEIGIAMLPGDTVEISTASSVLRVQKDNPTWADPQLMTTSHCYADSGEWFYLEIRADGMQMALASGDGVCPNSIPVDATIYYR
jgi:hypothetical protein